MIRPNFFRLLRGFFVVSIVFLLPFVLEANLTWRPPVDLSTTAESATFPHVAINNAGQVVAVWVKSGVIQARTLTVGGQWSSIENISASGAADVHLAMNNNGQAVAVWQRTSGTTFIEAKTLTFGAGWQAEATILSEASQNAEDPYVAINDAGQAVVVWTRADAGTAKKVVQAKTLNFGQGWATSGEDLSVASNDATLPRVAINNLGQAAVIWTWNAAIREIQSKTLTFGGNWSNSLEQLSNPTHNADEPEIGINNLGQVIAAWGQYDGTHYIINFKTKSFDGNWPGVAEALSASGRNAELPEAGINDRGQVVVVWDRQDVGTGKTVVQARTKTLGGSWSAVESLSDSTDDGKEAEVTINGQGQVVAVWRWGPTNLTSGIQSKNYTFGGSWSSPANLLTRVGQYATRPIVALDDSGEAIAV